MLTQTAIDHFKGVGPLADALGISAPAVSQWGDYPPDKRQLQLERITDGSLKAEPGCMDRLLGTEPANDDQKARA